jgi:hypothetical protein
MWNGCSSQTHPTTHTNHTNTPQTGNKPLTSPSTNLPIIDAADTRLVPNVRARGQVLTYKAAKKQEWEAAEQRWREWMEEQGQGQGGS